MKVLINSNFAHKGIEYVAGQIVEIDEKDHAKIATHVTIVKDETPFRRKTTKVSEVSKSKSKK